MWVCIALVTLLSILCHVAPVTKSDRASPAREPLIVNHRQKKSNLEELMKEAEAGEYTIRRVEFCCYLRTHVYMLTRKSLLVEGELFKRGVLVRGLKNLSSLKSVRPVTLRDVEVRLDKEHKEMDCVINLQERRRH
jgi:outer membrane protein assembly factor BamA